jgi:FkbM family methyltransferase
MTATLKENEVLATNRFAQRLILNRDVYSSFRRYGVFDWIGIAAIEFVLQQKPDAVCLDIGANIGNHTLAMSRFARHVYAFEPQMPAGIRLEDNVRMNALANVTLLPYGLSNRDESLSLFIAPDGVGGATTYVQETARDNAREVASQVRNGDQALDEIGVGTIDFIKVDVEGFEFNVVDGLRQHLAKSRPIVLMEWNHPKTKQDFIAAGAFTEYFSDYTVYALIDSFDRRLWGRSAGAKLVRALTKLVRGRSVNLLEFDAGAVYNNILLVPSEQVQFVGQLKQRFGEPRRPLNPAR